jgi:putative colanic acid biosynthesis UDP-glucose lipid carrier transferase
LSGIDYQHQLTHPIVLKRGTSLAAPVLLWLMVALPAVLAGGMFYPLTRMYHVEFDKPFLVLSILAAMCTLVVIRTGNASSQIISGRLELATTLLLRWAVLVASLLALGYVTKFSEDFSRRVVVTWVLVTPVLLVMLSLILQGVARVILRDAAQARRAVIVGCTVASMELQRRLVTHPELGLSVAGFFDDRGSDRLGCAKYAQLLGRFGDVASFVNSRNIDVIFIAIPPGQVARVRDLVHELGDTTASV